MVMMMVEKLYPNQPTLTYGIPNNSLFQILKTMFDCHVHRIPIIDRIHVGASVRLDRRRGI